MTDDDSGLASVSLMKRNGEHGKRQFLISVPNGC